MQTQAEYTQAIHPLMLSALRSPGLLSPNDFKLARYSLNMQTRNLLLDPDVNALEDYLIDHSGLPGEESNYALLEAFGDVVYAICHDPNLPLHLAFQNLSWLLAWLNMHNPPSYFAEDPDSPLQILQMTAPLGLGEWAAAHSQIEAGVDEMMTLAVSPLWRVRESAGMGLQRMLRRAWNSTLRRLRFVSIGASVLEWVAIVKAVSHPALLDRETRVLDALQFQQDALRLIMESNDAHHQQLQEALPPLLANLVIALPGVGFPQLLAWANWQHTPVKAVVQASLDYLGEWTAEVARVRTALDR